MCFEVRVFNTRNKLRFSSAVYSRDDVIRFLDSMIPYARTGWFANVDAYDEDDMDMLVDRDIFVYHDGYWSN